MLQPPELLKKIPLFQAIPDAYLDELADNMSELDVKKGEVLFRKGSRGTALYVIQRGAIKIVLPSKIGEEMIVAIFKEGDSLENFHSWIMNPGPPMLWRSRPVGYFCSSGTISSSF